MKKTVYKTLAYEGNHGEIKLDTIEGDEWKCVLHWSNPEKKLEEYVKATYSDNHRKWVITVEVVEEEDGTVTIR